MDLVAIFAEAAAGCFGPLEIAGFVLAGLIVRPLRAALLVGLGWGLLSLAVPLLLDPPRDPSAWLFLLQASGALTGSLIAMLSILIVVDSAIRFWAWLRGG